MIKFPIDYTLSKIGGKWKIIILCFLNEGTKRNSELLRLIPDVSQKMLTQQLRELEEDGIIKRYVHDVVPPCVEYSLSDFGLTLVPLLDFMRHWGEDNMENWDKENNRLVEVK